VKRYIYVRFPIFLTGKWEMKNVKKILRKVLWVLHEAFSLRGNVVWINHRIQEYQEAIDELKQMRGDNKE